MNCNFLEGCNSPFLFYKRKPLAKRVVQKSLCDEEKSLLKLLSGLPTVDKINREAFITGVSDINSISPNCVCVKVPSKGILLRIESGSRKASVAVMRIEGRKNNCGGKCPDYIYLFVDIPPKIAVSSLMGYLKGKSSTMFYE